MPGHAWHARGDREAREERGDGPEAWSEVPWGRGRGQIGKGLVGHASPYQEELLTVIL